MNYFDIIIGILIIIGAIRGFIKGFVSQLFGILALVVGIFAAIKFSSWAADKLVMWFHIQSELLPIISFLVVFGVIAIALLLVGKLSTKCLKRQAWVLSTVLLAPFSQFSKQPLL